MLWTSDADDVVCASGCGNLARWPGLHCCPVCRLSPGNHGPLCARRPICRPSEQEPPPSVPEPCINGERVISAEPLLSAPEKRHTASKRVEAADLAQLPAGARSALLTANMTNTSKRIARTGLMRARVSLLAVLTHERARRIRALNTLGSY